MENIIYLVIFIIFIIWFWFFADVDYKRSERKIKNIMNDLEICNDCKKPISKHHGRVRVGKKVYHQYCNYLNREE